MLTDAAIRNLKPSERTYSRTAAPGLVLDVQPGGAKTWRYRYRLNGRPEKVTLGGYPAYLLSHALQWKLACEALRVRGLSPADLKQTATVPTEAKPEIRELAAAFLAEWCPEAVEKARARSQARLATTSVKAFGKRWLDEVVMPAVKNHKDIRRVFDKDVVPAIGDTQLCDVTVDDVRSIVDSIKLRGSPQMSVNRNRTFNDERLLAAAASLGLHLEIVGAGFPVMFLHGFGASSYSWKPIVPLLPPGVAALLVDLKGFGQSEKPSDGRYGVSDHTRLISKLIATAGLQQVVLVGNSLGGSVALVAAAEDVNQGAIVGLVLVDAPAYAQALPFFIRVLADPVAGPLLLWGLPPSWLVRAIRRIVYFEPSRIDTTEVKIYAHSLRSRGGRRAIAATARAIAKSNMPDVPTLVRKICAPTLIIWGRQDEVVPTSPRFQ